MVPNPFTEEHELLRQSVRKFIETDIIPYAQEWEYGKECPRHVFEKMGELGFLGASYPEEVGGSGMDLWAAVVISSELAYANCGGLAMSLYAHTYLPLPLINALGTPEQKEKYLKPALQGKMVCGLGLTEPGVGSDLANISTKIEDKGDHYVLNGSKMWITNGTMADFLVLLVRSGEGYDLSLVIFDTKTEGFKALPVKNKLGMHTSDTGQLFFDNCIVPKECLLGGQGNGFYYVMNNIQEERLIAAVMGAYGAEWALEKAKAYAKEREAFGRPIGNFQVIRHKLAKMAIKMEACKSIAFRAVHEFQEHGPAAMKIITMAKSFVSEESQWIINEALQIHGGWGYNEDYGIARAWRDNRLMTIGAGTTEIMNEIISKIIIDERSHRKQFIGARKTENSEA